MLAGEYRSRGVDGCDGIARQTVRTRKKDSRGSNLDLIIVRSTNWALKQTSWTMRKESCHTSTCRDVAIIEAI